MMNIREATIADSGAIARFLLLAMEDIVCQFIGKRDGEAAIGMLRYFVEREQNQYSYQNCLVVEYNGKVIAAVAVYDGAHLVQLREPVLLYVKTHFNKNFDPEDETQAGEYYIDSLGVDPGWQGKGVGTMLLGHLIEKHVVQEQQTLGLLVDEENQNAKKLYLKLGFTPVGKKTLAGKSLEHLQVRLKQGCDIRGFPPFYIL